MFDVTPEHVEQLDDAELRELVARLARTELAAQELPTSAVTAGGHQDARDGGIDVRVETSHGMPKPNYAPRKITGFQVKKPKMRSSETTKEMRPKDKLRPAIAKLAEQGGAYIIVGGGDFCTDDPLQDRRQAMRDALNAYPGEDRLRVDFYDRHRLAEWTNLCPDAAIWLRERIGKPLTGWSRIGSGSDAEIAKGYGYIVDEGARVIDQRASSHDALTIPDALDALRVKLGTPGQCVRLISSQCAPSAFSRSRRHDISNDSIPACTQKERQPIKRSTVVPVVANITYMKMRVDEARSGPIKSINEPDCL